MGAPVRNCAKFRNQEPHGEHPWRYLKHTTWEVGEQTWCPGFIAPAVVTDYSDLIARLNLRADSGGVEPWDERLLREAAAALAEPCPGPHLVPVDESAEDAWYALAEPVVEPTGRCTSCEHLPSFHSEGGCWFSVTNAEPLRDVVCPCAAEPGPPPAEPTEEAPTTTAGNIEALCKCHALPFPHTPSQHSASLTIPAQRGVIPSAPAAPVGPTSPDIDVPNPEKRMVVLLNTNVKMTRHKAAAQAIHAALTLLGVHHGGPVIVLGAKPRDLAEQQVQVRDAGRTEVERGTLTAAAYWADTEEKE